MAKKEKPKAKKTLRAKILAVQIKMVPAFKNRAAKPKKLEQLYKQHAELNRKLMSAPNNPPKVPKAARPPRPPSPRKAKKRV